MKVYVVKYSYDNGEYGECFRKYTKYFLFSTQQRAESFYYCKVSEKYEGSYTLIEWELNTQKQTVLDESPYEECTPYDPYEEYYPEDDYDCGDDEKLYDAAVGAWEDPAKSIEAAFRYLDCVDAYCEENYHEEEEEYDIIEGINKDLTPIILDNYAAEFCKEWNKALGDILLKCTVLGKYDKLFNRMGYAKAWEAYKTVLKLEL